MNVLKPDKKSTIITLLKNGISQREIGRKANIDRKTIRKYARESDLLCDTLFDILTSGVRIFRKPGECRNLFTYARKPIGTIKTAMKSTCKRAGISYGRKFKNGFTFHDLRHTFVTNARKSGIKDSVTMGLVGHKTRSMFDRYNKIDTLDKQSAVKMFDSFLSEIESSKQDVKERSEKC